MWKIAFIACMAFAYGTVEIQEMQQCKVCNLLVGEIQELVSRGSTQELIMDYIRGICSVLPSEQKDVCGMFVGDNSLNLFNKVLTDLTPHQLCDSVPHICPPHDGEDISEIIASDVLEELSVHEVSECEICQFLVKSANDLVSGERSYSVVDETVDTICSQLPENLQPFCHVKGDGLVQHVVKHGYDAFDACTKIDACAAHEKDISHAVDEPIHKEPVEVVEDKTYNNLSEDDKKHPKKKMPVETMSKSDLKCELCEGVLELLEKRIQRTASEDMIKETMYELCNDLQTDLKDLCLQEAPQILKALEEDLNPFETCQKVMLCDATLTHGIKKSDILASLVKRMASAPKQIPTAKNTDEVKDFKCELCTGVIEELDGLLQQNATITEITATLHDICSQMHGDLMDLCFLIAPDIVKALMTGEDSQKSCEAIKLCQTEDKITLDDTKCEICEFIVKGIDVIIGKNSSEEKVNATVYKLCDELPGTFKTYCYLIAPSIVTEIMKGGDPQKVCTAIKLCTVEEKIVIADTKCDICEFIIEGIDTILGKNASADKINATVYKLCSDLPGVFQSYCLLIAPNIVKELETGADPQMACTAIKLCQANEGVELGDTKCDLCKFIIKEVDQIVGQNASFDKVNATVYKLCNDLSGTIKAFCLLIAPTVVKEIVSGADPQKACTAMKLCVAEADTSIVLTANEKQLECDLCMISLNPVITDIAGTYAKVQSQLLKLCNNLPVVYRTTCYNMLQNDNGRIFKQFLENYSPTLLCEMLACYENHDHVVKNRS